MSIVIARHFTLLTSADVPDCDAHLLNRGVVINDDGTATFEFEGTGPDISAMHSIFTCSVDGSTETQCKSRDE